jgi:arsenate reductase (glutaredoxin)
VDRFERRTPRAWASGSAASSWNIWFMQVTIYHNPHCSNSRKALEIIRSHGIEPKVIEYLKTPLTPQKLRHLIKDELKMPVRDVMRSNEPAYADMKLDGADDDTLFAAIAAHPILLNRPIVVTDKGAKLCRPGETVEELL